MGLAMPPIKVQYSSKLMRPSLFSSRSQMSLSAARRFPVSWGRESGAAHTGTVGKAGCGVGGDPLQAGGAGPARPGLTVSMWLSSQLSILRNSFLLMRRGFLQQQRRLEYLSKLFTSTWTAHSSSVHSAIATCGEGGSGMGVVGPSTCPCSRTGGGRAGSVPPTLTVPSLRACTGGLRRRQPWGHRKPPGRQKAASMERQKAGTHGVLVSPRRCSCGITPKILRATCPTCPPGAAAPARGTGQQLWRWGRGAAGSQGSLGRNGAGSRTATGRGQELPAGPPLASRLREHPSAAGLDLPEPPTSPANGIPRIPGSNPACSVFGVPFLSPRSRGCPKPGSSFLWMDPTGWSPSRGPASASWAGRRQGRKLRHLGLGSFLPRRWQGEGRAGACCSPSFHRSHADLHRPWVQRRPPRQQWVRGSWRKPTGRLAWSPEGWPSTVPHAGGIIQEGVRSPAAPGEPAGPARRPKLGSHPLSLCTNPPQSSPRPRTSAHQRGDERHEAQPWAPRTLTLVPVCLGTAGCPPKPSLSPQEPSLCHEPGPPHLRTRDRPWFAGS